MRLNIVKMFPKACETMNITELFIETSEIISFQRKNLDGKLFDELITNDTTISLPAIDNGIVHLTNIFLAEAVLKVCSGDNSSEVKRLTESAKQSLLHYSNDFC
jgi:hypothetical protein